MTDITFSHETTDSKGRYLAHVAGKDEPGEMTYSRASADMIIIDHTDVPDSLRGTGVGAALARHVVEQARASGTRIFPLCPFFKAQLARHPDWADVISG